MDYTQGFLKLKKIPILFFTNDLIEEFIKETLIIPSKLIHELMISLRYRVETLLS